MPDPSPSQDPKPIADAGALFGTDDIRPIDIPPPKNLPASATEGYDLEGFSFPEVEEPPRPLELPTPVERPKAKSKAPVDLKPRAKLPDSHIAEGDTSEFETEISVVSPVWSRGAEWGPDLVRVGIAGGVTLFLVWMTLGSTVSLLILMAGGAATAWSELPNPDHHGAAGSNHARAGGQRLLRRRLAPLPPLPTDVAVAQLPCQGGRPFLDL